MTDPRGKSVKRYQESEADLMAAYIEAMADVQTPRQRVQRSEAAAASPRGKSMKRVQRSEAAAASPRGKSMKRVQESEADLMAAYVEAMADVQTFEDKPLLIGQGAYGCVYRPGIPCNAGETGRGKVSKILSAKSADKELSIYDSFRVDDVDPEERFTIKKPRRCPLPERYQTMLATSGCRVSLKDPTNLIYTDGGMEFYAFSQATRDPADVLPPLLGIFYIVSQLNRNNKFHMDVKSANIVVMDGHARLIDYGLSIDRLPEDRTTYTWAYPYWPPELPLIAGSAYIKDHISKYHLNMVRYGFIDRLRRFGIDGNTLFAKIDENLRTYRLPSYNEIMATADVWGLAMTVIESVENSVRNMTPEAIDELRFILQDMTHPNITRRATASEAYHLYRDFINRHYATDRKK